MENYIKFLKEKEEELNSICREKGFEVTIVNMSCKYDTIYGGLIFKKLDNTYVSNFTINFIWEYWYMRNSYYNSIGLLNENGRHIDDVNFYTIPKLIYNFLNVDNLTFVCEFEGGKYDKKILSKEEMKEFSIYNKKLSKNSTFIEVTQYIPFTKGYLRSYRPSIDYGIIYYKLIATENLLCY